jgi:flagellar biosynthetic protein FliO
MNKFIALFKNWLESSSRKQKLTAALLVFSILSTLGLMVIKGASGSSGDPLESTPFYFIGVFVKLIVVLLLIVASSVIFRRWLQPGGLGKRTRHVQLLETVRLSPKQALHLITVGDQQLLVGATDQGISLITQVELDLNIAETEVLNPQPATDFASLLQTFNSPNGKTKSS